MYPGLKRKLPINPKRAWATQECVAVVHYEQKNLVLIEFVKKKKKIPIEEYFDFIKKCSENSITMFLSRLVQKNVGGWREIISGFNYRYHTGIKRVRGGVIIDGKICKKRKPDSNKREDFALFKIYNLRLHAPNSVKPFQEAHKRQSEWSYQLSREGSRNITAGILKSDLTIKLLLPATLSDK